MLSISIQSACWALHDRESSKTHRQSQSMDAHLTGMSWCVGRPWVAILGTHPGTIGTYGSEQRARGQHLREENCWSLQPHASFMAAVKVSGKRCSRPCLQVRYRPLKQPLSLLSGTWWPKGDSKVSSERAPLLVNSCPSCCHKRASVNKPHKESTDLVAATLSFRCMIIHASTKSASYCWLVGGHFGLGCGLKAVGLMIGLPLLSDKA